MPKPVGVLALQGDFTRHRDMLEAANVSVREVQSPEQLEGISGLLLPGGESTSIAKGLEREGLSDPIRRLAQEGMPMFGTCAGFVLMGDEHLGLIDMSVDRNAFGPQIRSFETDLAVPAVGEPSVRAVLIRAPVASRVGNEAEVLAEIDGRPVAVRQENRTAISFHPELVGDARIHLFALGLANSQHAQRVS